MNAVNALLANPNIAILTLLAGIFLIYGEANRPGLILPGCFGTLLILLSAHALHQLPLRDSSIVLGVAALALILLESILKPRFVLGVIGMCLLSFALRNLVEPFAAAHVHTATAIFASLLFGIVTILLGNIALQARRNKRVIRTAAPHRID